MIPGQSLLRPTNPRLGVPLSIGPVSLHTNLLLAPIAGYCDLAFRIVCREQGGLGLACTDLLSPHGVLRGTMRSLDIARTNELDRPLCMQLYGAEGEILAQGAEWAVDHGAAVIDINMGCPVDKVTKKNGGSMLLCDPGGTAWVAERVVRAVERASAGRVPVTAKMRLGWDDSRIVAPRLACDLAAAGIRLVTVHGRTTVMRFTGRARLDGIARVVEAVGGAIPVLGNGDVTTPWGAIEMMERTGCNGVMIGRGALAAPWIFRQAWRLQQALKKIQSSPRSQSPDARQAEHSAGSEHEKPDFSASDVAASTSEPSEADKLAVVRRYFDLMLEYRGERYALHHIGRRITWFARTLGPCRPLRERLRLARSSDDVRAALDEFEAGGLRFFSRGVRHAAEDAEAEEAAMPS